MAFSQTPLTEKDVHDAADALNAEGEAPTYRAVRRKLKRGSFSDIRDGLKTWHPKDKPETPVMPAPSAVSELALTMSNELWLAALTRAEALANEKLSDAIVAKQKADSDARQLTITADEYAAENDQLRTDHGELVNKFEQACQWGRERELEAAGLRAEVNTLRDTMTQLMKAQRGSAKAKAKVSRSGDASTKNAA